MEWIDQLGQKRRHIALAPMRIGIRKEQTSAEPRVNFQFGLGTQDGWRYYYDWHYERVMFGDYQEDPPLIRALRDAKQRGHSLPFVITGDNGGEE